MTPSDGTDDASTPRDQAVPPAVDRESAPDVSAPDVSAPDVSAPDVSAPEVVLPAVGPTGTSVFAAVGDAQTAVTPGLAAETAKDNAMPSAGTTPRWSARAAVPSPTADADGGPEWEEGFEPPQGLFTPLMIALTVLALVTIVGAGVYLGISAGDGGPTPVSTRSAPPTRATPTARPTSRPPASTAPAPSPSAMVGIPDVVGFTVENATSVLEGLGFVVSVIEQNDASVPAGSVIGTSPEGGGTAVAGSTVSLIVSSGPPVESPSPTPTPTVSPEPSASSPSPAA